MLWVLIRGKALLMSTHNMFLWRNKKNIMWIPPLICSYVAVATDALRVNYHN